MPEQREISPDICPICYKPKSAHAPDCDYEQKLEKTKKAEGITPEFEEGVKSGKITYESQIQEIDEYHRNLFESVQSAKEVLTKEEKVLLEERFKKIRRLLERCDKIIKEYLTTHSEHEIDSGQKMIVDEIIGRYDGLSSHFIRKSSRQQNEYSLGEAAETLKYVKALEELVIDRLVGKRDRKLYPYI